jgi:hypothetical protein
MFTHLCSNLRALICAYTTLSCTALYVSLMQVFALWPEWQAELPEALQPPTTAGTTTVAAAAAAASAAASSTDAAASSSAEAAPSADDEDSAHVAKRQKTAP